MTDNVINIQDKIDQMNGPDPEHVVIIAENGCPVKWFEYSYSFMDGEKEYSFNVWARDYDDALRRVDLIKRTVKLNGQVLQRIPE